jgi:ubiquitin carboxyl-terminal hydrolase 7
VQDLEAQSLYSSTPQFYDFLQNRVLVQFRPKYDDPLNPPDFELMLSKKMTYDVVRDIQASVLSSPFRWHTESETI